LDTRPARWATVTVKLVASDVDPAPPACSSCSTGDVGRVEISRLDPDDQRAAMLYSGPIQWVDLDRASAGTAYVSAGGLILTLVDRGAPGSKVIGRQGPTGVAPTRDSVRVASLGYPRMRTYAGAVRTGAIEIRRRH
jgi:hypothetical protein